MVSCKYVKGHATVEAEEQLFHTHFGEPSCSGCAGTSSWILYKISIGKNRNQV